MGPLIFAALRFCLALSTLHTSTADRRHKTLYRDSVEREEEKGRAREKGNRKRIAQTRRLYSIVFSIYNVRVHAKRCKHDAAMMYFFFF